MYAPVRKPLAKIKIQMIKYYEILQVDSSISNNDLRARMMVIADQFHPNSPKNNSNSFDEFINSFVAFDILLNPTYCLIIRRIERSQSIGVKLELLYNEISILENAEKESRHKAETLAKGSLEDFKELYKPDFLMNFLRMLFRFGT